MNFLWGAIFSGYLKEIDFLYLPVFTLAISLLASAVFLTLWFLNRKEKAYYFLFWGFFSAYWFKLTTILANMGVTFLVPHYATFFSVTFFLYFTSLVLLLSSVKLVFPSAGKICWKWHFIHGAIFVVFLTMHFFGNKITAAYTPIWLVTLLFYLPLQVNSLYSITKVFAGEKWSANGLGNLGGFLLVLYAIAQTGSSLWYIHQLLNYAPSFWFVAIISAPAMASLLQGLSVIFFASGFLLAKKWRRGSI